MTIRVLRVKEMRTNGLVVQTFFALAVLIASKAQEDLFFAFGISIEILVKYSRQKE